MNEFIEIMNHVARYSVGIAAGLILGIGLDWLMNKLYNRYGKHLNDDHKN